MTVINNPSKQMQNGDNVTVYNNTVGTVTETFTFPTSQETIVLSNKGSKNITYTIGANTGTLTPSTFVKVIGAFSSFSLSSEQGTQAFEVWSEETGTLGVTPEAVQSLGNQVSGFSGQLSDITTQMADLATVNNHTVTYTYNPDGSVQTTTEKDGSNTVIKTVTYTYNAVGDVATSVTVMNGKTVTTTYNYDTNANITSTSNVIS